MHKRRPLTRSKRRKCSSVSAASERRRIVPSSHPNASIVDAGLAAMLHIEPPCEGTVRLTQLLAISHSRSSLPPPQENKRRSDREGVLLDGKVSGNRMVSANVSTFEGFGPGSVLRSCQACRACNSSSSPVHSRRSMFPFACPTTSVPYSCTRSHSRSFPAFLALRDGSGKGGKANAVIGDGE